MSHADSGTRNTNAMTILCRMYVGSLYKQDASNKKGSSIIMSRFINSAA